MNGWLYDPKLRRFLSPDVENQAPDNSQNYNRYSYCLNNPINFVDLSGNDYGSYYYEEEDDEYGDYGHDDDPPSRGTSSWEIPSSIKIINPIERDNTEIDHISIGVIDEIAREPVEERMDYREVGSGYYELGISDYVDDEFDDYDGEFLDQMDYEDFQEYNVEENSFFNERSSSEI